VLGASFAVLWLLRPRQGQSVVRREAAEVLCALPLTITITTGLILVVAGVTGESLSTLLMSIGAAGK
jgi:hypothetical protein